MAQSDREVFIDAFGMTDVGRVRATNQDTFAVFDLAGTEPAAPAVSGRIDDRGVLLAVSDGMGGAQAGEVASALVMESLERFLGASGDGDRYEAMRRAVEAANRTVFDEALQSGRVGMGATLVAALVQGPFAYLASVGDSRAYLIREGAVSQVTRDQSFVETLVSAGVMTREQAEGSGYRHVILQAMGVQPEVTVALGQIQLHRGDVLLLCSDGLSNEVTADEMERAIAEERSLAGACRRLVDAANAHGGRDNITVVVARFEGDGLARPRDADAQADTP